MTCSYKSQVKTLEPTRNSTTGTAVAERRVGRPRRRRYAHRPPPHYQDDHHTSPPHARARWEALPPQQAPLRLRGPSCQRVLTARGKALRAETTEVTPQHHYPSHLVVSLWRVCHTSQDLSLRYSDTPPRLYGHTPTAAYGVPHCPRLPTEPLACSRLGGLAEVHHLYHIPPYPQRDEATSPLTACH